MQTNEHVDLATWLTAVWDEDEREFLKTLSGSRLWGKVTARRLLTYIIRDRKILALHSGDNDEPCQSYAGNWIYEPCETLRLLASPYADRPGFRSEWLVERQGVEG